MWILTIFIQTEIDDCRRPNGSTYSSKNLWPDLQAQVAAAQPDQAADDDDAHFGAELQPRAHR